MNVAKGIYFKMDWSKSLVPSALEKQNTSYKHVLLGSLAGYDSNKSAASNFADTNAFNNMSQINDTYLFDGPIYEQKEFIFDRKDVRIIFITLYTLVFCCCFFGNLLVILVVTMSRRLRSITNFFLANLAVADFCVGIFCVFQNLSIYLIPSWVFGDFLCKMYQFVHSLSYTASIFILIVICMERYFAIIHPITCKQILTSKRLRLVIVVVWLTSALYSAPKFIFVKTITNHLGNETETICVPNRKAYNSHLFDIINFGFLYVTPLFILLILYTRIAITLWKSSNGLSSMPLKSTTSNSAGSHQCKKSLTKRSAGVAESEVSVESDRGGVTTWRTQSVHRQHHQQMSAHSTNNVLRARRGVVRMLMVVVLTFALCNLPLHARKMWQYWSNDYRGDSNFNALFTPLTFLVTYFNSGVNPLLYAFLSRNFRKGMSELLVCTFKKNKNKGLNQRQTNLHVSKQNSFPMHSTNTNNNHKCLTQHTNETIVENNSGNYSTISNQ